MSFAFLDDDGDLAAEFLVSLLNHSLEQFDLSLGLMVPVTATPRPGVAERHRFLNNHHAPSLALHPVLDPIFFVVSRLDGLDGQALLVHLEVVAVESMPGRLPAFEGRE